jgi:mannose-6-phosphate isomerase-like protein (cupin superfamily)
MRETLERISAELLQRLRNEEGFGSSISLSDYHGFQKGRIPEEVMISLTAKYGTTPDDIQAEIVLVESDLSREVHRHSKAHAYCTILGEEEHFDNPNLGYAFRDNKWFEVDAGDNVDIPPNTAHGFTTRPGGVLYFLSLQSPPIESADGHDDYQLVTDVPSLGAD